MHVRMRDTCMVSKPKVNDREDSDDDADGRKVTVGRTVTALK